MARKVLSTLSVPSAGLSLLLGAILDDGAQNKGRQDAENRITALASAHGFLPKGGGRPRQIPFF
jgi:hypothetical protein